MSWKPELPHSQFSRSPQSDSNWKLVAAWFLMPQILKLKYKDLVSPYKMKTNWKLLPLILAINKARFDKTGKETVQLRSWRVKTSEISCRGLSLWAWKIFWHLEPLILALVLAMSMAWNHPHAGHLRPEYLGKVSCANRMAYDKHLSDIF